MKNNEAFPNQLCDWPDRVGFLNLTIKSRKMHHCTAEGWISIMFGNQIMKRAVMHHWTEYELCTMFLNVGYELLWMLRTKNSLLHMNRL